MALTKSLLNAHCLYNLSLLANNVARQTLLSPFYRHGKMSLSDEETLSQVTWLLDSDRSLTQH